MAKTELRGEQIKDQTVSLTADVKDVLPIANGGTNASSAGGALTSLGAAAASHTHNASDVNAGTLGIARIPTGTTSSTVCIGNDSRLADTRTPSANTVPSDFFYVELSPQITRAVGLSDWTVDMYVGRAFTMTGVVYQFETADASGNTTVEVQKNGSQATGSSKTVSAANQADGSGTDSARTASGLSVSYAAGDRFGLAITAIGTTPGKGLKAWILGTYN
ncbi:hypothetical protein [Nocardia brasiliensis]|uniref:hypothetical protein n=1 Tax=Nocardia brasiliensis TaxID=37326 RepID=UPI00245607CB|nr:hypothetical protein [Nocardia brasiliensis]